MEWLEVSVEVDGEAAEAVAEALSRYVYRGVAIEAGPGGLTSGPVVVRAYLPAGEDLSGRKRRIEEALYHLGRIWPVPSPRFRPVAAEDWTEVWKERFDVMHVTERIVVRPSWKSYDAGPGELVITLDPGQAFGTGLHPTTRMCLQLLEHGVQEGGSVLDLGTGSGILAIAAAGLGAAQVLAVDNDPVAAECACTAVAVNNVADRVEVRHGTLADVPGSYDVVVVNILARVVMEMLADGLADRVDRGGLLIATGILEEQAGDVEQALARSGLGCGSRLREGDWVCLTARRTIAGAGQTA